MSYLIAVLASMVGTILQRISGAGVSLVAAPFMAVFFGPVEGILLTNLINAFASGLLCVPLWKDIDWPRFWPLFIFALFGEAVGARLVISINSHWLELVIGAVVFLAMLASWLGAKKWPPVQSPLAIILTGFIGGVLMSTASIGAPATVIYASLTGWHQRAFRATMQPLFSGMAATAFIIKMVSGVPFASHWLHPLTVVIFMLAMVLAIALGGRLSHRMSENTARNLAFLLAAAGAVVAFIKGALALWG